MFLPVTPNKVSAIPIFELTEAGTVQNRNKPANIRTVRFSLENKLLKLISNVPIAIKPKTNAVLALKILIGSYEYRGVTPRVVITKAHIKIGLPT